MRKRWFMKAQIIDNLKEHQAGLSAAELCKKHGISDASFCRWRSKLGGMEVVDGNRMRGLMEENERIKKLLAHTMTDVATLREMLENRLHCEQGQ